MSQSIANLTWPNVPGSTSTLVEYKLHASSVWIQPGSPLNPTPNNYYPLLITDALVYDVRLTTNGVNCGPRSTTLQIVNPAESDTCCPDTYTLSSDGTYCYKFIDVPATPPDASENTVAVHHADYSAWGTLIYNPGYNINGTGSFTQIAYSNTFWVNGAGYPSGAGINTVNGPLNRTGVWSSTLIDGQTVGFSVCVTAPSAGTYYVGTGSDNFTTIRVNGIDQVVMDPTAMANYLNANGYGGLSVEVTFRFWHVYPVNLLAGDNIIEIIGNNVTDVASIGVEVYDATSAELQLATSYVQLGSKLLFSTKDYVGQPIQLGSNGIGYTCPSGYSLVLCEGTPFCRQLLTTPTIVCGTVQTVYNSANLTGLFPDEATILAAISQNLDASANVPFDWTSFNGAPMYCWAAIPDLGLDWEKNEWFVDSINTGPIGGLANLFGDPQIVTVTGVDYLVWMTNYQTQFIAGCEFRKV